MNKQIQSKARIVIETGLSILKENGDIDQQDYKDITDLIYSRVKKTPVLKGKSCLSGNSDVIEEKINSMLRVSE